MNPDTGASPDVIISDIGLPEVDGYTFMRKVREINSDDAMRTGSPRDRQQNAADRPTANKHYFCADQRSS